MYSYDLTEQEEAEFVRQKELVKRKAELYREYEREDMEHGEFEY